VKKFVAVGTICAYPKFTPVPFKERTSGPGIPRRRTPPTAGEEDAAGPVQAYRQQYGFNSIFLLPVNLYGPGDNFDPASSHVIPALIRKVVEAKRDGKDEIEVWGTGRATREFLYVDDCAEAIVLAAERYDGLGAGEHRRGLRDLDQGPGRADRQARGLQGRLRWDATKPTASPAAAWTPRAQQPATLWIPGQSRPFSSSGLAATIEWYGTDVQLRRPKDLPNRVLPELPPPACHCRPATTQPPDQ
jgi:GDP-L-fucose synthase